MHCAAASLTRQRTGAQMPLSLATLLCDGAGSRNASLTLSAASGDEGAGAIAGDVAQLLRCGGAGADCSGAVCVCIDRGGGSGLSFAALTAECCGQALQQQRAAGSSSAALELAVEAISAGAAAEQPLSLQHVQVRRLRLPTEPVSNAQEKLPRHRVLLLDTADAPQTRPQFNGVADARTALEAAAAAAPPGCHLVARLQRPGACGTLPLLTLVRLDDASAEAAALSLARHLQQPAGSDSGSSSGSGDALAAAVAGATRIVLLGLAPGGGSSPAGVQATQLLRQLLNACAAAAAGGDPLAAAGVPQQKAWGDSSGSAPGRNLLADKLQVQLAAARSEVDALHVHYTRLLDALAGPKWRSDTVAIERPPAPGKAAAAAHGGDQQALTGIGAAAAAAAAPAAAVQQQQQQPAASSGAWKRAAAGAAAGGGGGAAAGRAADMQRLVLESQLDAAKRAQRAAEERVALLEGDIAAAREKALGREGALRQEVRLAGARACLTTQRGGSNTDMCAGAHALACSLDETLFKDRAPLPACHITDTARWAGRQGGGGGRR